MAANLRVAVRPERHDSFKMYPDPIMPIGLVKAVENARKVLPAENSRGENV